MLSSKRSNSCVSSMTFCLTISQRLTCTYYKFLNYKECSLIVGAICRLAEHLARLPGGPTIKVEGIVETDGDGLFVKETDKLILHELLWSQQESIKNDLFR